MHSRNAKARPALPIARQELPALDLLRSFEAAARHLSFTVAARELFLTQSAVSRQIQQVEASVGVPLFERRHRSLALTEAGLIMQRAVVDCLERLRDATRSVRATSAIRLVAITCTPSFASLWLIPRLARFTARFPSVDVRISATAEVLDLQRHQVDVAVRFMAKRDGQGPPLFEESLVPVCSPKLVSDRRNPLREPADLANHRLVAVDRRPGEALTVEWEPWLRVMGLPEVRMKNSVRFTNYTDAVAGAVAGQGVLIGQLPLLAEMLRDKRLVAPFGSGAASQHGYYILFSDAGARNADAQAFARWLRIEAEAAGAAG